MMLSWNRIKWRGHQAKVLWQIGLMSVAISMFIAHQRILMKMSDPTGVQNIGHPSMSILSSSYRGPTRYAYVFYAANDPYGCSALVNMARLRRLNGGLPRNVDLILIASEKLSASISHAAVERTRALIYNANSFPLHMAAPLGKFADYYRDSVDKFLGFLLPSDVYRRVILLDADCLILRPPNHLFELPDEIPFAAPKAYWYWNNPHYQDTAFWRVPELRLSRQDFLTSWIMSVSSTTQRFACIDAINVIHSFFTLSGSAQ